MRIAELKFLTSKVRADKATKTNCDDDHLIELLEAYRVYRVREDPKTKYRYVTEILNKEEGLQLIGGKKQEGVK